MCIGPFMNSKAFAAAREKEQINEGEIPQTVNYHPETGQQQYPDKTYNEHSGAEIAQDSRAAAAASKQTGTLKGDTPLTTNTKKPGSAPGGHGGGEINY